MSAAVATGAMARPPPPPPMTVGYAGWLRKNLFSSWANSLMTIVLAVVLAWAVITLISWIIFTADWEVITSRVQLYLVGLYPQEEAWRPQVAVLLISALLGISWRSWGGTARGFAVGLSAVAVIVGVIPHGLQPINRVLVLVIPAAVGLGYLLAARLDLGKPRHFVATALVAVLASLLLILDIRGVDNLESASPFITSQVAVLLVSVLFGMSWRSWGGASQGIGIGLAALALVAGALPYGMPPVNRVLVLLNPVAMGLGFLLIARVARAGKRPEQQIGLVLLALIAALVLIPNIAAVLLERGWVTNLDAGRPNNFSYTVVLFTSLLLGMSWRSWGRTAGAFAIGLGVLTVVLGWLPDESMPGVDRALLLLNPVAIGLGYLMAAALPVVGSRRMVAAALMAVIAASLLVLSFEGVPGLELANTRTIGGLLLNLLLALFGIGVSMPIGIALALGRQSNLPVVKMACVAFIEVIRGVPLITLLFMSRHILPLTFPENIKIDTLFVTAITIMAFSSAYMAENVRGGMAAVAPGQTEAARALGLRGWQTTLVITLPQGLRNIIPAIVGQFISLFKDTSLVFIIGMLDLVEMGRVTIQSNLEFIDNGREVYLFIAIVFWIFCFSMSYVSRRIERALGVGQR